MRAGHHGRAESGADEHVSAVQCDGFGVSAVSVGFQMMKGAVCMRAFDGRRRSSIRESEEEDEA